jgi:hypothetical protein
MDNRPTVAFGVNLSAVRFSEQLWLNVHSEMLVMNQKITLCQQNGTSSSLLLGLPGPYYCQTFSPALPIKLSGRMTMSSFTAVVCAGGSKIGWTLALEPTESLSNLLARFKKAREDSFWNPRGLIGWSLPSAQGTHCSNDRYRGGPPDSSGNRGTQVMSFCSLSGLVGESNDWGLVSQLLLGTKSSW